MILKTSRAYMDAIVLLSAIFVIAAIGVTVLVRCGIAKSFAGLGARGNADT